MPRPGHDDGAVSLGTSVLTFALVALALTLTPGPGHRARAAGGPDPEPARRGRHRRRHRAGLFVWGAAAAVGVSALLTASQVAYDVLRFAGAAYLVWFGLRLLVRAVRGTAGAAPDGAVQSSPWRAARQGLATNLLNPKVGVFYVALLPQFLPPGSNPLAVGLLLAGVHGADLGGLVRPADHAGLGAGPPAAPPSTVRAIDGVTGTR